MRRTGYISVVITMVFAGVGLSLENPSVGNPVGSGTAPPSASRPSLIQSPNPIDTSGNLVITGNVTNGMQFRGIVPYNSPTSFSAPASSLSHTSGGLDSFLRDSAGSQNFGTSSGGLTPYYSPTWTVTTTQPGGSGNSYAGTNLPAAQTGYYQGANNSQVNRRPLSLSQQDLEKLVATDTTKSQAGSEVELKSQNQFWRGMGVTIERKDETVSDTDKPTTSGTPSLETLLGTNSKQSQLARDKQRVDNTNTPKSWQAVDIYEQMKTQSGKFAIGSQTGNLGGLSASKTDLPKVDGNETNKVVKPGEGVTQAEFDKAYKSFAARSEDKFNQHMRAAEGFMKQGRFYRAADAYTLASIFKPNDPLGYAGKSLALFGSGEYLSSSLFLARTLEIFPEYAKVKVDIVGMIGDKDTVENRILEARSWMDKSDSGELEFLLSYIYCQMDRMEFARMSIEAAAKKMPSSPAVAAMKKTIDERLAKP
jgi:hypothetical protein